MYVLLFKQNGAVNKKFEHSSASAGGRKWNQPNVECIGERFCIIHKNKKYKSARFVSGPRFFFAMRKFNKKWLRNLDEKQKKRGRGAVSYSSLICNAPLTGSIFHKTITRKTIEGRFIKRESALTKTSNRFAKKKLPGNGDV